MTEPFKVDTDTLRQHAQRVQLVANDVAQAKAAVASVNVSGGAFGLMCAFLVPPAHLASSVAMGLLGSADAMMRRTADTITEVANNVDATEETVHQEIKSMHQRELGPL